MKTIIATIMFFSMIIHLSCSQAPRKKEADKIVGDGCEGCEAVSEYGNKTLNAIDTLPDFDEQGPKILVTGTIFKRDGRTPAKNVILYIYHTNQQGIYQAKGNEKGWAKRH